MSLCLLCGRNRLPSLQTIYFFHTLTFLQSDLSPQKGAVVHHIHGASLPARSRLLPFALHSLAVLSSTRTELSAKTKENTPRFWQNQAEGSSLHLTSPDVRFFMFKTSTSGKAKCEFLGFQRNASRCCDPCHKS